MFKNGIHVTHKSGRPGEKVKNLRRFARQWAEYEDETQELLEFDRDDVRYISGVLFVDASPVDKYRDMANLLPEV